MEGPFLFHKLEVGRIKLTQFSGDLCCGQVRFGPQILNPLSDQVPQGIGDCAQFRDTHSRIAHSIRRRIVLFCH